MAQKPDMQSLLTEVLRSGASDLHIGVGFPPSFRLDGSLQFAADLPALTNDDVWGLVTSLLRPKQVEDLQVRKDLDFSFTFQSQDPSVGSTRFRGNCYFERGNVTMALRNISSSIRTLRQLMLPEVLRDLAVKSRGLFLVTGPTGSGKSTTLAAMVQEININRRCHIVTIEDPIEYLFSSDRAVIHQREVGGDTASFNEALRRVLRQDPDVIMLGEMRDLETIGAAITAAETGHFVLATLHTPDAAQTVDRIVDVFPSHQQAQVRQQVSNILVGIMSQQLVALPAGGRIVACELLLASPAARNCIREGKVGQLKSIMQTSASTGMRTMDQDLARLVREGRLPFDDALACSYDPRDLERLVFEMD